MHIWAHPPQRCHQAWVDQEAAGQCSATSPGGSCEGLGAPAASGMLMATSRTPVTSVCWDILGS